MLADPRAEALSTRFAAQWLRLQDVEKLHPDALLFPSFDHDAGASPTSARRSCSSTASCARIATSSTCSRPTTRFVNERIAQVYGIPNIVGDEVPARHGAGRAPRHPRPGQRADADRGRRPHLAGAARQVDHGSAARLAAAAAAAERAAALDETKAATADGKTAVDARAHGGAPQEPGVHVVPPRHRSARPGARELRHRSARGASRTTASPSTRTASLYDGTPDGGSGGPAAGAARQVRDGDPQFHRQPDVVSRSAAASSTYDQPTVRSIVKKAAQNDNHFSSFVLGIVNSPAFQMSTAEAVTTATRTTSSTRIRSQTCTSRRSTFPAARS